MRLRSHPILVQVNILREFPTQKLGIYQEKIIFLQNSEEISFLEAAMTVSHFCECHLPLVAAVVIESVLLVTFGVKVKHVFEFLLLVDTVEDFPTVMVNNLADR